MTLTCLSVRDCSSPAPFHLHSSQVCGLPPEDFLVFSDTEPGKIHFLGSPICPSSKPKVIVNFLQDHKSPLSSLPPCWLIFWCKEICPICTIVANCCPSCRYCLTVDISSWQRFKWSPVDGLTVLDLATMYWFLCSLASMTFLLNQKREIIDSFFPFLFCGMYGFFLSEFRNRNTNQGNCICHFYIFWDRIVPFYAFFFSLLVANTIQFHNVLCLFDAWAAN